MILKRKLGFCFPQKSRGSFGTPERSTWISLIADLFNFKVNESVLASGEGNGNSQLSVARSRLHRHSCQLELAKQSKWREFRTCRKGLFVSFVAMRSVSLSGMGVWGCYWNPLEEVDENQCLCQ